MRITPVISFQNNKNNIQSYKTNPVKKNQTAQNNNLPVYFSHPVAFGNLILDKDKKKALAGHEIYQDACKEIFKTYYASETPLILYKNGSNPEFIYDTFKSMLAKNKFAKIGLQPKTTKVFLIDDFYGRMKKQKKKASKNESGETALAVSQAKNEDNTSYSYFEDPDKPTAKELILKGIVEEKTKYLENNKDIKDIVLFVKDAEQVFPDNLEIGSVFDSKKHIKFVFLSLMPTDEDFVDTEYPDSVLAENNLSKIMFYGMERSQAKEFFSSKANIDKFFPTADVEVAAVQKAIDLTEDDESRAYPEKVTSFIGRIIAEEQFKNDEADYKPVITEEMVVETYKANAPKEDEKSGGLFNEVESPKVTFDDVGGMKHIKEALKNDVIDLIKAEDKQDLPKGVLLEGPPGTGKTLLAKAIAGEAKVPFIPCSGSDFVEVYVGQGAKRVRELFEKARELADKNENKTAILFIDEIDAVAKARGSSDNDEREQTINAILAEMDGVKKNNKETHVIVLAATNRADMLDEAIVRPGRFDLKYNIPNPRHSESARYEIAKIHAKDKPFKNEAEKEKIIKYMAQSLSDISGAEIEAILKMANRMIKRSEHKGPPYITIDDINAARLEVLAGAKTDNENPDFEIEQTIMHEAGHALNVVVLQDIFYNPYDKPVTKLDFITNEARKGYSGATYLKPGTAVRHNFKTIIQELAISYGGASAERVLYGANADGVGSDIDSVRENIEWAVIYAGLGPNCGNLNLSSETMQRLYAGRISADVNLMQRLSQKISDMIVEFHKDFLLEYKNLFDNNKNMKVKLITSEDFKKLHADWLKDTGREKAYVELQSSIREMIETSQKTGIFEPGRRRIGFDV